MKKISIYEVGPRDGFQNVADYISVDVKKEVIKRILDSGVKKMQVTSFVSPKSIPQLRDASEIARYSVEHYPQVYFSALVPNLYGAKVAWESGIQNISYVISLSPTHNQRNINRTHEQSFEELEKIQQQLPQLHIAVDVATIFGCPFEGKFSMEQILSFLHRIDDMGIEEMTLADTIGIANPKEVREIVTAVKREFPHVHFVAHIHDTRNMGMVNTLAAIESGIDDVQSTLGGLGGCPFAPGASGNTATEDLVYMLNEMGYDTGVNFEILLLAAKFEKEKIEGNFSSHHICIDNKICMR